MSGSVTRLAILLALALAGVVLTADRRPTSDVRCPTSNAGSRAAETATSDFGPRTSDDTVLPAPVRPRAIPPERRPVSFQDRLLPAPVGGGFRDPGYWVWCGTVVKGGDGKYHHFASRWPRGLPFGPHWLTNSEVVHSVSTTPEGPYQFVGVALPPRGAQ
jgi:hypothetical protein